MEGMVYHTQELMAMYPPGKRSHFGDKRHEDAGAVHYFLAYDPSQKPLSLPEDHPLSYIKLHVPKLESEGNAVGHHGWWKEQGKPFVSWINN